MPALMEDNDIYTGPSKFKTNAIELSKRQFATSANMDPAYLAEDNRPTLFAISGTFMALGLIAVCLRMYARVKMIKRAGFDDWMMVVALIFSFGFMICSILMARYGGLGRHLAAIPPEEMITYWHYSFFRSQFFVVALNVVKISIALFLMRLATLSNYRKFLWGSIVFMVCFTIACLATLIFECSPIAGAWDPAVRAKGHCYSATVFKNLGLFNTVVNVTTDVMYATIPLPLIWKLQLDLRRKISICIILSLGYFASAVGIVMGIKQANWLNDLDYPFWDDINVWGFIQLQVGIIAACAPTLKPLFRAVLEYSKAVASGKSSNGGSGGNVSGAKTPGSLSYIKSNSRRCRQQTSIQLSSITCNGEQEAAIHTHTDSHGYDVRVEIDGKYHNDGSSANESSKTFDPVDGTSPKNSQENILPNNIYQWAVNNVQASPGSRPQNTITRTTEVTVQSTTNFDLSPSRQQTGRN